MYISLLSNFSNCKKHPTLKSHLLPTDRNEPPDQDKILQTALDKRKGMSKMCMLVCKAYMRMPACFLDLPKSILC